MKNLFKRILRKTTQKALPTPINIKDDEFFKWLSFAVPGMTGGGNILSLGYAIKHLPSSKPLIEIGSFCGLSTLIISHFKNRYEKDNQLYTCDKWEFEGQKLGGVKMGKSNITHDKYKKFIKESYIRNIQMFSPTDLPYTVEVFSDEFFDMWKKKTNVSDVLTRNIQLGGQISFAFIDGNHTYDFAKRDFKNVDTFLEKGGFILFDDSSDFSHWKINRVAKEAIKSGKYELIAKNPNYLLRKK